VSAQRQAGPVLRRQSPEPSGSTACYRLCYVRGPAGIIVALAEQLGSGGS
jgi:hypothetical protein